MARPTHDDRQGEILLENHGQEFLDIRSPAGIIVMPAGGMTTGRRDREMLGAATFSL